MLQLTSVDVRRACESFRRHLQARGHRDTVSTGWSKFASKSLSWTTTTSSSGRRRIHSSVAMSFTLQSKKKVSLLRYAYGIVLTLSPATRWHGDSYPGIRYATRTSKHIVRSYRDCLGTYEMEGKDAYNPVKWALEVRYLSDAALSH